LSGVRSLLFWFLLGALKIGLQLLNDGIPSLFSFQRISVDSYRQFVLAPIIVVIDFWLFGHLFAAPAAKSAFRHRAVARGHSLSLRPEESSSLGSGAIFGRGSGGDSGLVVTSLFRVNARPTKPIAIKLAPPIISQCGNWIDESNPIISSSASFRLSFQPLGLKPMSTIKPN
jgi:hypothetical protein